MQEQAGIFSSWLISLRVALPFVSFRLAGTARGRRHTANIATAGPDRRQRRLRGERGRAHALRRGGYSPLKMAARAGWRSSPLSRWRQRRGTKWRGARPPLLRRVPARPPSGEGWYRACRATSPRRFPARAVELAEAGGKAAPGGGGAAAVAIGVRR